MTGDWRTGLEAARQPPTPEQQAWDALWQPLYDRNRAAGRSPNASIARADDLMDLHNRGTRPEPKETQT